MAPDEQDRAESTDDDEFTGDTGDYPPEHTLGAEDYGITAAEQQWDEPLEERIRREEPERQPPEDDPIELTTDDRGMLIDDEPGDVADAVRLSPGRIPEDNGTTGDSTLRDYAAEHEAPLPAEEAAVHIVEE
ncbi:MAG: hypothetical protein JWM05_2934 [Acidimicrobiales bacterium]|nr:hypothetical protein [Acidimicrobiales bacterium]